MKTASGYNPPNYKAMSKSNQPQPKFLDFVSAAIGGISSIFGGRSERRDQERNQQARLREIERSAQLETDEIKRQEGRRRDAIAAYKSRGKPSTDKAPEGSKNPGGSFSKPGSLLVDFEVE